MQSLILFILCGFLYLNVMKSNGLNCYSGVSSNASHTTRLPQKLEVSKKTCANSFDRCMYFTGFLTSQLLKSGFLCIKKLLLLFFLFLGQSVQTYYFH